MLINRSIYIILLMASFVFSSFFGGYIPELIRYVLMLMPLLMLAYITIIYVKILVRQEINGKTLIKGQDIEYRLTVKDTCFLPVLGMKLVYNDSVAKVKLEKDSGSISLVPGEKVTYEGRICCKYAGTYSVGVEYIIIPDVFNLFKIKYKPRRMIRVQVRPKEYDVSNIKSCISSGVSRNPFGQFMYGHEKNGSSVRNYIPGDNLKRIHWKSSAKMHKLLTKQREEIYEESTALIIDNALPGYKVLERIKVADKILHITVALCKNFAEKGQNIEVFERRNGKVLTHHINSEKTYDAFYSNSESITFLERKSTAMVMNQVLSATKGRGRNIVIVAGLIDKELKTAIDRAIAMGCNVTVIAVTRDEHDEFITNDTCNVVNVNIDDDICEVLSE